MILCKFLFTLTRKKQNARAENEKNGFFFQKSGSAEPEIADLAWKADAQLRWAERTIDIMRDPKVIQQNSEPKGVSQNDYIAPIESCAKLRE